MKHFLLASLFFLNTAAIRAMDYTDGFSDSSDDDLAENIPELLTSLEQATLQALMNNATPNDLKFDAPRAGQIYKKHRLQDTSLTKHDERRFLRAQCYESCSLFNKPLTPAQVTQCEQLEKQPIASLCEADTLHVAKVRIHRRWQEFKDLMQKAHKGEPQALLALVGSEEEELISLPPDLRRISKRILSATKGICKKQLKQQSNARAFSWILSWASSTRSASKPHEIFAQLHVTYCSLVTLAALKGDAQAERYNRLKAQKAYARAQLLANAQQPVKAGPAAATEPLHVTTQTSATSVDAATQTENK